MSRSGSEVYDPGASGLDAWKKKIGAVDDISQIEGWLEIRRSASRSPNHPSQSCRSDGSIHQRTARHCSRSVCRLQSSEWWRTAPTGRPGTCCSAPSAGGPAGCRSPSRRSRGGPASARRGRRGRPGRGGQRGDPAGRDDLAIQGPPGSGKTFTGARMILELVAAGKRVGITAKSHKVIGNLLEEVCLQARPTGSRSRQSRRQTRVEDSATTS